MPETLILHLGLHKTATTSLQNFLADHVKALLAASVVYHRLSRMRSDITPLICSMAKRDRTALQRLVDQAGQPVLLLSDENILGSSGDIYGGALYPFAENRVRRLCEQFANLQIRLFLTLRSPAAFLVSMYCEYLRHHPYLGFKTYVQGYDVARFSYARTFDWMSALPRHVRVTVTPFEPALGGGVQRIAGDLLDAACGGRHGIDLATFPQAKSRSSFSAEEIDLAATIAARADAKTAQIFLNMLESRGRRFGKTRFDPLPPDTAARLEARYAHDLEVFARLVRGPS